jgi:CheY-like chemotaxis protein
MPTILVVDDHDDTRDAVALVLGRLGYDVTCQSDGPAAMAYLAQHVPDLVLLDVSMPGVDGLQVLRAIRADARTARLPVVVFTAYDDEGMRRAAADAGATDYWVKAGLDVQHPAHRLTVHLNHGRDDGDKRGADGVPVS